MRAWVHPPRVYWRQPSVWSTSTLHGDPANLPLTKWLSSYGVIWRSKTVRQTSPCPELGLGCFQAPPDHTSGGSSLHLARLAGSSSTMALLHFQANTKEISNMRKCQGGQFHLPFNHFCVCLYETRSDFHHCGRHIFYICNVSLLRTSFLRDSGSWLKIWLYSTNRKKKKKLGALVQPVK